MAVGLEQPIDDIGLAALVILALKQRLLARLAPYLVNDLVLEYAGEPGFDRGFAGKTIAAFDRGEQCFLHHVLGGRLVAQLEQRVAHEIPAELLDLAGAYAESVGAGGIIVGHCVGTAVAQRQPLNLWALARSRKGLSVVGQNLRRRATPLESGACAPILQLSAPGAKTIKET